MAFDVNNPDFFNTDNVNKIKTSVEAGNKNAKEDIKAVSAKTIDHQKKTKMIIPGVPKKKKQAKVYSSLYLGQDDWKALKKGAKISGYSSVSSFVTAWIDTWKEQI